MNLDDESLLSAYLDDELDPADRLAVEWSIESNPPLAEQYRSLIQARTAVSSLPRPEIPQDLGPVLRASLAANRRRERLQKLATSARAVFAFSSFVGIAAGLIFALIVLNHSLHESDQSAQIADQHPDVRPYLTQPNIDLIPSQVVVSTEPAVVSQPVEPRVVSVKQDQLDETRELTARRVIDGMLEQPHLRRIRIVTDVVDASNKVKDLIHQDGRMNPEFGRISICQDIVIDPECADAVEVFAVPMEERYRHEFVEQLARTFPNLIEETEETSPHLVTQLSEVGQVALFRGTEAAPLADPPRDLRPFIANRAEISKNHFIESDTRPIDAIVEEKSLVGKTSVANGTKSAAKTSPSTELKPGDRVTVLVWVVTRPTRRL